ncbi:MAG: hypothetical protein KZQ89_11025 [Candidatus Thiodiazotropha sp. (ex Lucinoma kastoroae)]|nr:hypothetical protein [Candidatus Thiodiazotropha sp. (ex Rostrolucina anterorostrata)]MCU7848517.1 hypothetical protein [Candidatus Thiodiazotropha sp. (ex Lucinoma kastoroae)]MCU7860683.1 hypothetical protein [Candidatus Thiodiazotropha sp. (ex Lucinoma kastoroae)]
MKRLLQETGAKVSRRERKCLTRMELANLRKRYRNILTRGEKELPLIPPKPSTKRGKLAKSDAHNLWVLQGNAVCKSLLPDFKLSADDG